MSIEWRKELKSGIPALDYQHLKIFESIEIFLRKCECSSDPTELFEFFDDIDNYSKNHFSYEENLQSINNYPGLDAQHGHHKLFLQDLDEFRTKLTVEGPSKELAIAAKGKLIRWWIQHIKNLDGEFIDFLKTKQS